MNKYCITTVVLALFVIGFAASDESEEDAVVSEEVPAEFQKANVADMLSDLNQNEMRAQKKYSGQWMEITGVLGAMDSEGEYFSLDAPYTFGLLSVHCKIPETKRDLITNKLVEMEKGDKIVVKGRITDMGEIMGYDLTVIDVTRIKKKEKDIEKIVDDVIDIIDEVITDTTVAG